MPTQLAGRKANIDIAPRRAVVTNDEMKTRAAPIPKKWNGAWPLLVRIAAERELQLSAPSSRTFLRSSML
ncbi:hypothetical protein NXC24_PB00200 (plasmid) [Rhizobium sp. NXC24]|nr:hypothetical protein NXC24_PB00200 [Rhizobium sp. NXC24]